MPTLHQFSGDAYLNEMGVTNPEFPDESCPQGDCAALAHNPFPGLNDDGGNIAAFTDFMTLLGPPPQGPVTPASAGGNAIFKSVGCADCHTPIMQTGDSPVRPCHTRYSEPFSDFLLHDMGSLGDGIVQGTSTATQMRTAPPVGPACRPTFLHDGRATTPEAPFLPTRGKVVPLATPSRRCLRTSARPCWRTSRPCSNASLETAGVRPSTPAVVRGAPAHRFRMALQPAKLGGSYAGVIQG